MFSRNDLLLKTEALLDTPLQGEPRHIAFAADQKYLRYIGIAMFSILANNPELPLHFHLFIDDMSADEAERFRSLHTPQSNFCVSLYYLNGEAFSKLQLSAYFSSPAIYYRLVIPTILHTQKITKILYLDTDTLCTGNLSPLLDLDLKDAVAAAASDIYMLYNKQTDNTFYMDFLETFGFCPNNVYFNSGMLLIDIHKWITLNIDTEIQNLYQSINRQHLTYPDQDILNIVLQHRLRLLSERYNWIHWHEKRWLLNETTSPLRIIHFIGKHKPWHLPPYIVPIYADYTKRSPWHDTAYEHTPYLANTSEYRRYARYLWQQGRKCEATHHYLQYLLRKIRLIPKDQS